MWVALIIYWTLIGIVIYAGMVIDKVIIKLEEQAMIDSATKAGMTLQELKDRVRRFL